MTFLYDARYSLVLLRPKNEVKLLTQCALGQICTYGEIACAKFRDFFHRVIVVRFVPELSIIMRTLP